MTRSETPRPDPRLWRRLDAAMDDLLEKDQAERRVLLAKIRAEDPELEPHLERLLLADARAQGVLEADASGLAGILAGGDHADGPLPDRVGPYLIERELGRGGMGTVYKANRDDGQFDQTVAIKVIKRGMDSAAITRRFLRERQILAHLQHPNIAGLLDGGVTEHGLPYFVMEYVDGRPLTTFAAEEGLDRDTRIALVRSVCEAVRYAQQRLVVHRDLKPNNILVTADGTVKLLDFGIAKVLSDDQSGDFTLTRPGLGMVTPGYAAPEQTRGEAVTTATDVFALGVVLLELLTGRRPADSDEGSAPGSQPATGGGGTLHRSLREIPGDLGNIVGMAMREEPERRYPSAEALLDDLRRWQEDRPVQARADSAGYRLNRYLKRHRVAVTAAVLVVLALAGGLAGTLWQARKATDQATRAREVTAFLTGLFEAADPDAAPGQELTARDLLAQGAARLDSLSGEAATQLELARLIGSLSVKLGDYDGAVAPYEQALVLASDMHGKSSLPVRRVLNDLGSAHLQMMRFDVADSLFNAARVLWNQEVGSLEEEAAFARLLNDMAVLHARRDESEEAEKLYRQALALDRKREGPGSLAVATDLNNLGVFLAELKRFDEAREAQREALAIRNRLLPPGHSQVILSLHNLAFIMDEEGDLAAADSLFTVVVRRRRELYPQGHPLLAGSLDAQASVKTKRKEFAAAEDLLVEALEMRRRILGDDHPDVAAATNDLALVAYRQGDFRKAAGGFAAAFAIFEQTLPATHPTVITVQNNAAGTYLRCDDLEKASEHYLRILVRLRELGPGQFGPLYGKSLFDAGQTLHRAGHLTEAIEFLQLAVDRRVGDPQSSVQLRAETRLALGRVLLDAGRVDAARQTLRDARDGFLAEGDPRAEEASQLLAVK